MTDENSTEMNPADELAMLKTRATLMGITFSNNIGLETLRERVRAKMEGENIAEQAPEPAAVNPLSDVQATPDRPITLREYMRKTQMKLVRLRIANLDPKKKDLPGEIITVANEYLGTVRKFVPYGEVTDGGFHVPYCIYQFLDQRRFLNIKVTKRNGREHVEQTWAKEFSLEIMPPLTQNELNRLASAQAAAGSIVTAAD